MVGTKQRVLVEGASKGGANLVEGRTDRNEIVHLETPPGRAIVGAIVEVDVVRANKHSLVGELTTASKDALVHSTERPVASKKRRMLPLAG